MTSVACCFQRYKMLAAIPFHSSLAQPTNAQLNVLLLGWGNCLVARHCLLKHIQCICLYRTAGGTAACMTSVTTGSISTLIGHRTAASCPSVAEVEIFHIHICCVWRNFAANSTRETCHCRIASQKSNFHWVCNPVAWQTRVAFGVNIALFLATICLICLNTTPTS